MSETKASSKTRAELLALARAIPILVRSSPLALAGLLAVRALGGLIPAVTFLVAARVIDHAAGQSAGSLTPVVVLLGALFVVSGFADAYQWVLSSVVESRFGATLQRMVMRSMMSLPGLHHFEDPASRNLLQQASWVRAGPMQVVMSLMWSAHFTVAVLGAAAVAGRAGWWTPLVVIAAGVPATVSAWRHAGAQTQAWMGETPALRKAKYHYALATSAPPAKEVRLFTLGEWIADRHRRLLDQGYRPYRTDLVRQARDGALLGLLKGVAAAIPFVWAFMLAGRGVLTVGDFAAVAGALASLVFSLHAFESNASQLRHAAKGLPQFFTVIDLAAIDSRMRVDGHPIAPGRVETAIRFEGVRFRYPSTEHPVLDGLDLVIPAGSSVALVGENGAGKSTLIKLLCRFYDPDEGRITIDGTDIRDLDLDELRSRIACVFQDFVHYPLSARANIGFGCVERIGDPEVIEVSAARAGCLDLVTALPDSWDTTLAREFGGVDLSGGEWQRVALARAFATQLGRNSSILVLDEPSAALDVRVEANLYARFAELTRGLTTILVSHRLSTVRMADTIAVLRSGRIVEAGSHSTLVEAGGLYAELWDLQSRRFIEEGKLE